MLFLSLEIYLDSHTDRLLNLWVRFKEKKRSFKSCERIYMGNPWEKVLEERTRSQLSIQLKISWLALLYGCDHLQRACGPLDFATWLTEGFSVKMCAIYRALLWRGLLSVVRWWKDKIQRNGITRAIFSLKKKKICRPRKMSRGYLDYTCYETLFRDVNQFKIILNLLYFL